MYRSNIWINPWIAKIFEGKRGLWKQWLLYNGGLKVEGGQFGNCPTSEKQFVCISICYLDFKDGDLMSTNFLNGKFVNQNGEPTNVWWSDHSQLFIWYTWDVILPVTHWLKVVIDLGTPSIPSCPNNSMCIRGAEGWTPDVEMSRKGQTRPCQTWMFRRLIPVHGIWAMGSDHRIHRGTNMGPEVHFSCPDQLQRMNHHLHFT